MPCWTCLFITKPATSTRLLFAHLTIIPTSLLSPRRHSTSHMCNLCTAAPDALFNNLAFLANQLFISLFDLLVVTITLLLTDFPAAYALHVPAHHHLHMPAHRDH